MHIDPNWQADQLIFNRIACFFIVAVLLLGFTVNEMRRRQCGRPNLFWVLLCYMLGLVLYGAMCAVMATAIQQPYKPVFLLRSLQVVGAVAWLGATAVLYRGLSRQSLEEQRKQS